ncbi:MAG: DegT/DnrJ/EryC1/StrS family aminotransferase [Firmicutes bacterium]|nr:DegT/DnrJ/EryC1/StrS family aminotransferase [Bacillota bacterium]
MTKKSKFFSEMPEELYFGPAFDDEEIEAVTEVMRSLRITQLTSGVVGEFEEAFADYVGAKEAVAVNSGTASLHTALIALGIEPGDEVLVPAFTFIGTVGPVMQAGATPVFVDIHEDTYCLSVEDAARKITSRTKAIMPVDLFGHPADLDPIRELADSHGLAMIDDACQSHGAKYKDNRLGSLAPLTCFSFQETKNMTTGEGGMITTDDPELAEICREIRHQGEKSWGVIGRVGYNYRLTALQAAIGLVQLGKLDKANDIRRAIAKIYTDALAGLELQLPEEKPYAWSVYHVYSFLLPKRLASQRDKIVDDLLANRVSAGVAYPSPLYTSPVFQHLSGPFDCPIAEDVSSRVITLPTAQSIPLDLARKMGAITAEVLEGYLK